MNYPVYTQHKDDVLIYTWDFTRMLASGETISTAAVVAEAGLTTTSATIGATNLTVTSKASGGTLYAQYLVTCTITTSAGQTINRSLAVNILPQ